MTTAEMLRTLDEFFTRGEWETHAPLRAAVEDLTAEQAAWTPERGRRSIWQIVRHLTVWMEYLADRLAGGPPRDGAWFQAQELTASPEATGEAWRAEVGRMVGAHERLRAELSRRSDADLARPLAGDRGPLWVYLQVTVGHNSYHCGQIRLLRALQGAAQERW